MPLQDPATPLSRHQQQNPSMDLPDQRTPKEQVPRGSHKEQNNTRKNALNMTEDRCICSTLRYQLSSVQHVIGRNVTKNGLW